MTGHKETSRHFRSDNRAEKYRLHSQTGPGVAVAAAGGNTAALAAGSVWKMAPWILSSK